MIAMIAMSTEPILWMSNMLAGIGFSKLKRTPVVNRAMKNIIMITIRAILIALMSKFLCKLYMTMPAKITLAKASSLWIVKMN